MRRSNTNILVMAVYPYRNACEIARAELAQEDFTSEYVCVRSP